ncbi:hypothetical protein CCP3SC1AL1_3180003 [Gammaproteobacteria bacterium]
MGYVNMKRWKTLNVEEKVERLRMFSLIDGVYLLIIAILVAFLTLEI